MHVAVGGPPLDAGDPRDDQIRRLRACVRDLVALSTVPAMWQGSDLETTARNMAGLLLSTSRLEYAFLNVHRVGAEPLAIAEWRAPDEAGDRDAWVVSTRQVMHARRPFEPFEFHIGAATPLRAMTLPLGIDARQGIALVASASSDFPSETEQVLLRVSATQYAISLRSAALLEEARGAEERSRLDSAAAQLARAEAEAANRAKADFLASMSHELRTPLNAIGGYAALMEMGLRGPVTAQQVVDLQRIRRSQEYLLRLINDVLNFAKLEAGHIHVDHTEVEVDQVLDHLEELVGPQVAGKHLEYTCKRGDAPLVALGTERRCFKSCSTSLRML
jgi:signal transduction histidine kinase